MSTTKSALVRVAAIAPVALAATFGLAGTASAAATTVSWTCQGTVDGIAQTSSLSTTVTGTAPATATSGSTVAITLTPGAVTVPSTASGFTVNSVSNVVITTAAPTNSTLVSATAGSGGTGTVAVSNGAVVLTVPGPIAGGATYTPAPEDISVTAGTSGQTIQTLYAGSSFSSPGMTLTVNVQTPLGPANVATVCYANPNPTLTSTTIS
jgi:dehydratase